MVAGHSLTLFLMIVCWLAGFYLQVVPIAILCIYPFRDHFKCSNKTYYIIITCIIIVESIVWLIAVLHEYFTNGGINSDYLGVSDAFFISSLLILLGIFIYGINARLSYKLFVFILGMSYGFAIEVTNRTINNFHPSPYYDVFLYSGVDILHYILINAVLFYPVLKLMKIIRGFFNANLDTKVWRILTSMLSGVLLLLMVFYEIPYALDIDPLDTLYIFIDALFLFIFFLYYWIFSVIREELRLSRNEAKWKYLADSYKLEEKNLEEIRKVRHELRHHLSAIQLYLQKSDYDGLQEYLDKLSLVEDELPVQAYSSDNLFNLLLSDYHQRLNKSGIKGEFDVSVLNKLNMEDVDLIELFSNILDNAIEATQRVEGDRFVRLTVKQNNNFLTIKCENIFNPEMLVRSGKKFVSNKMNTFLEKHGIGMNIMKEIVKKYNGYISFDTTDNIFSVSINLNLPNDNQDKTNLVGEIVSVR